MSARNATVEDRNIAYARLQGLGAWNGNGLLMFLASTSKKDNSREWMEPLRDLCEKIVESVDAGESVKLSADEAKTMEDLHKYDAEFSAALKD
jgi:hypothetical protein